MNKDRELAQIRQDWNVLCAMAEELAGKMLAMKRQMDARLKQVEGTEESK